jgi:hypothetical protein
MHARGAASGSHWRRTYVLRSTLRSDSADGLAAGSGPRRRAPPRGIRVRSSGKGLTQDAVCGAAKEADVLQVNVVPPRVIYSVFNGGGARRGLWEEANGILGLVQAEGGMQEAWKNVVVYIWGCKGTRRSVK